MTASKRPKVPDLSGYLTPGQAARRLRVSPQRIGQLARAGTLPSIPTPLGRLFHPADVDERRDRV